MRLRIALVGLSVLCTAGVTAPTSATETTDTRVVSGTGSSGSDVFVTYVGCNAFFGPAAAPVPRVNLGPHAAPAGRRSLGLVTQGTGTASGPYTAYNSLSTMDDALSVTSSSGTRGVSYIWAFTAGTLPGTAWSGRADVSVPAGGWHEVRAADLRYTWSLVDLRTQQTVSTGGHATPGEFAGAHGEGRGYVMTGFGCDGTTFNIDAVRNDGTLWDFEGITLTTAIGGVPATVPAGGTVTVTGTVTDTRGRKTGDPLVLESRSAGGAWRAVSQPVLADPHGVSRVEVVVEEPTEFRWYRPESQYADAGWSDVTAVQVSAPPGG